MEPGCRLTATGLLYNTRCWGACTLYLPYHTVSIPGFPLCAHSCRADSTRARVKHIVPATPVHHARYFPENPKAPSATKNSFFPKERRRTEFALDPDKNKHESGLCIHTSTIRLAEMGAQRGFQLKSSLTNK